ncbi:MAG: hypothetical protein ACPG8V_03385 [Alphaproteobacteria bacterium]
MKKLIALLLVGFAISACGKMAKMDIGIGDTQTPTCLDTTDNAGDC